MHRITDYLPDDLEKVIVYEVFERGHIGPNIERFTLVNPDYWTLGSINSKNHADDGAQVWWERVPDLPDYEKDNMKFYLRIINPISI